MKYGTPFSGDQQMLTWISGVSNRLLASSCFNDIGQLVNEKMFYAILRWDTLEDAYNAYCEQRRHYAGRLSDHYCIKDMLDNALYDRLMERYAGKPPVHLNLPDLF